MNATAEAVARTREVSRVIQGMATSDGAGVKLTRVIGQPRLPDLDPFLMLDEFGTDNPGDYIGGFPAHPHRVARRPLREPVAKYGPFVMNTQQEIVNAIEEFQNCTF